MQERLFATPTLNLFALCQPSPTLNTSRKHDHISLDAWTRYLALPSVLNIGEVQSAMVADKGAFLSSPLLFLLMGGGAS